MQASLMKNKNLNSFMLIALVTGTMIGSGIFTLPATLASYGTIGLVAWILTACGAILLALTFAELSILIPRSGGPYAYCRFSFGDFIGFQVAYNYWVALWVGNAAIVVSCVGYLSAVFPIINENPWFAFLIKTGLIWLFTGVNLFGVRNAAKVQLISLILKILPLLLIGIGGIFFINYHHFSYFNVTAQSDFSVLGKTATLTLWTFIGLEAACVPTDNVERKQSIKTATILGTVLAACIYILCTISIMGLIPLATLAKSNAPFSDAAQLLLPRYATEMSYIIALGAVVSCLGSLNGSILLQGQVTKACAKDNLFPAVFVKENQFGAPKGGLIISAVLISLLLLLTLNDSLLEQFQLLILMATLASLIPYFLTALSTIFMLKDASFQLCLRQRKKIMIIALLACVYAGWAILSAGFEVLLYGGLVILSGLPIYYGMRYNGIFYKWHKIGWLWLKRKIKNQVKQILLWRFRNYYNIKLLARKKKFVLHLRKKVSWLIK